MIFDTSYYDKILRKEINDLVDSPYSLMDRFKLKGIGSSRFILSAASENILKKLPTDESTVKVSIELRPKGIILHFKRFTEHFSWVIPYYKLTIYSSKELSIYENETFMRFSKESLKKKSFRIHQKSDCFKS
jgi:hypothetical protein